MRDGTAKPPVTVIYSNDLLTQQLYTNEFVPAGDEFIPPRTGPDKT